MRQYVMAAAHMPELEPSFLQSSEHRLAFDDRKPARVHRSGCNGEAVDARFYVGRYLDPVFPIDLDYSLDGLSRICERLFIGRAVGNDRRQRGNANGEAALGLGKQMDCKASFRHSHARAAAGHFNIIARPKIANIGASRAANVEAR